MAAAITNQTEDESITPDIDGDLRDRLALLVDERLLQGGDTWGAILIAGTKDSFGFGIITNNLRRMTVTSAGRVLIKTETESTFDLDVAGTGRFTGNVTIGNTNLVRSDAMLLSGSTATMIKANHNAGSGGLSGTHIGAVEGGGGGWVVYLYPVNTGWHCCVSQGGIFVTDTPRTAAIATLQNAKAALQVSSTARGCLLTRMTGAEAEAIAPGATEDMLLVSITNGNGSVINSRGFWYWDNTGATWVKL